MHDILIAEDEFVSGEMVKRRLAVMGRCLLVGDGQRAVAAIEEAASRGRPFDLAVLDVRLPGLTGPEVLARLRDRERALGTGRPTRVILASAAGNPGLPELTPGLEVFAQKPLSRETLARALDSLGIAAPELSAREGEKESAPLDWPRLLDDLEGDVELARRMLSLLASLGRERFKEMGEALAREDFKALRAKSHALRGSAAEMHAERLSLAARDAERAAGIDRREVDAAMKLIDFELAAIEKFQPKRAGTAV